MAEIAIKVTGVSKNFLLPHERRNSIKSKVVNLFKNTDKTVEVQHALKDISFEVKKGEFFGILGRNGSGKSTLLKILAEIYKPTSGDVNVKGKLVPFIELGVGFNPELTGRENVYLNGALLGFSKSEIDARYNDIVEFAELEGFMDQRLKNYSSGMQVRLAFSVATRADADILLIDEVLAVGDADFQRKCYDYFKSLKKLKKTVVFVSHDMSAIREFCDRAILIEKSKKIKEGNAEKVATEYSRLFLNLDDEAHSNQSNERWGDKRASFNSVKITSAKVLTEKSKTIDFTAEFTAYKDIDTLVSGSSITNAAGVEICGTNTQHQRIRLDDVKKGEKIKLSWSYDNIFSDGIHTINVTLHGLNSGSVADWWEGAEAFSVKREEKSPFPASPVISLAITRKASTK